MESLEFAGMLGALSTEAYLRAKMLLIKYSGDDPRALMYHKLHNLLRALCVLELVSCGGETEPWVRFFDALVGALDRLDTAGLEAAAAPLDKASAQAYDVYAKEFRNP
jgi:hypothetical protein